ncbi:terminase large subunit domain-containing protein [Rhizobium sp. AG207R]|uniref:terminase large subunit domain-containing protein n=1 Tax=Rhizobium sp. AG207R TaxID=2802287 RepID=UPI0022AC2C57|nr:terminase family protein [Rhizobium sp. AG207R]MCZ3377434.1 terminase family protein [Rhizobium sp. AG207R]
MQTVDISQLEAVIASLTGKQRKELEALAAVELKKPFLPNPGPQTTAMLSEADILLYGGQAGGGKTALEIGAYFTGHYNGLILRREAVQLDGLIEFCKEVGEPNFGKFVGGNENVFKRNDGGRLKFAGLNQPDDWRKHAGNAKDYLAFDEAGEFLKEQVFSLIGWLRSTREGQRCRVILGSNPPRGGDGEWMIVEFAPWLDPSFPNKASPGELRWAIVVASETEWVDGPGTYERNGEEYEAMSRTFIPASLNDNPYLKDTGYRAKLQSLPEPLRSQLLYGDFNAGRADHEWQVIPSEWIRQAQLRWISTPPANMPMTAVAADVAQGGADKTQIQARYDYWYSQFKSFDGKDTPDGPTVAAEIVKVMRDRCRVVVDAGGGYGGDTLTQLAHADVDCYGFKGSQTASGASRDGMFRFYNLRAQVVWQFREQLDPEYGSNIALPPDPELAADLAAYRYEIKPNKKSGGDILVGPKEEMRERLGRSPDKGDTTIMLSASGLGGLKRPKAAQERRDHIRPVVNLGYAKHKARR